MNDNSRMAILFILLTILIYFVQEEITLLKILTICAMYWIFFKSDTRR